jgi:hypothetical protein
VLEMSPKREVASEWARARARFGQTAGGGRIEGPARQDAIHCTPSHAVAAAVTWELGELSRIALLSPPLASMASSSPRS